MAIYRKCTRCKQHMAIFNDTICEECREEEYQRNYGE